MQAMARWYAEGRIERIGHHEVFVREDGAGPPLLLIHGFPTCSWDWAEVWPSLARDHRVLTLDLLGFGRSERPPGHRYRIAEQADLCAKLLRSRGIGACDVLAHDYGDTVAQELLARAEEGSLGADLRSVVFLNGGLFPESHRPLWLQRLLLTPLGPLLARMTTRRRFAASLNAIFGPRTPPTPELIEGFWSLLDPTPARSALPALLRYIPERHAQRARWVGAMLTTQRPIAFINGSLDPISGAHMAARWRELLPHAPVMPLPDIGHYPQIEAPEAVLQAYSRLRAAWSIPIGGG